MRPRNLKRGYIVNQDTMDTLLFQYNPPEWYTEHGAKYEVIESPGAGYRKISYAGRDAERFPLTLNFYGVKNIVNGKSSSDIEDYLEGLTVPQKRQRGLIKGTNHFISPPVCVLVIGDMYWEVVVENVKITRKLFNNALKTMQLEAVLEFIVVK